MTLPLWLYGGDGNNTLDRRRGEQRHRGRQRPEHHPCSNGVNTPQTVDDSDTTAAFPGLADYFQDTGTWTSQRVAAAFNGEELSHADEPAHGYGGLDICQSRSDRVL